MQAVCLYTTQIPIDHLDTLLGKGNLQGGGRQSACKWPTILGSPKGTFGSCGNQKS